MTFRIWADLRSAEFASLVDDATVALLPVGAIEQHGPHLPVSVDTTLATGMALEAAKRVTDANVLVLPTVSYGKSDEHLKYPGVVTLDAQTLLGTIVNIGKSVARAGVRRLVLMNAHGGNVPVLQLAARQLRIEADMFVVCAGWLTMGTPEGLLPENEARDGIHAGFVETSAMLYFREDLVDMSKAKDFVPAVREVAENNAILRMTGPVSVGWMMHDMHPEGAAGQAHLATVEAGKAIVEYAAERYARLLGEVAAHKIPFGPGA